MPVADSDDVMAVVHVVCTLVPLRELSVGLAGLEAVSVVGVEVVECYDRGLRYGLVPSGVDETLCSVG